MRVTDEPASSGETFLVDDVSIKLLSGSPPPDAAPIVTAPADGERAPRACRSRSW